MTMILRGFYILLTFLMIVGCSDRNLSVSVLRSELKAKTCASGEYRNTTSDLCEPAGAGYYAAAGSDERRPCDPGRYCSSSHNTSGSGDGPCAGGKFCPSGSTDAQGSGSCNAGYYCPAGSATASGAGACLGGTYSGPGQSVCSACTFDTATFPYATAVAFDTSESALETNSCAIAEVTSCKNGFRINSFNKKQCRAECSVGQYWSSNGCQNIPKDSFSKNGETLTACPEHSQTVSTGATSITECLGDDGYYDCAKGVCSSTTTDGNGKTYSPAGTNILEPCPAGYACGTGFKEICPAGTYSSGNTESCSPCLAGYDCPTGAISSQGVGLCPPEKYSSGGMGCMVCTNKPNHALDVVYRQAVDGNGIAIPVTNPTSCQISHILSCETGWTPSADGQSCRVTNKCIDTIALSAGSACEDKTFYVGEQDRLGRKFRLMATPSNCYIDSGSGKTFCASTSTLPLAQDNLYTYSFSIEAAGAISPSAQAATSTDDGAANTVLLKNDTNLLAAKYCKSIKFGGSGDEYDDWFLPAIEQLRLLRNFTSGTIGIQSSTRYWSSTVYNGSQAYTADSSSWNAGQLPAADSYWIRCMREVEVAP